MQEKHLCKNMFKYRGYQNDYSDEIIDKNLLAISAIHNGLTVLGKNDNIDDIKLQGPMMNLEEGTKFLSIISMACKAIIACTKQLDIMDLKFEKKDYGTNLACGAKAIEAAIQDNKILRSNPFATFSQISYIIGRTVGGYHGGFYSLFFHNIAEGFSKYANNKQITAEMWLNVLSTANRAIEELKITFTFNIQVLTVLVLIEKDLTNSLNEKMNPIDAFGSAVKIAENSATDITSKYPDPQKHAVGIWMRAVYEGIKLKFTHLQF